MNPIDAYLADLYRRLRGRLPASAVDAKLREARAHLQEAVTAEGEEAALRRFGNPAANARAIVRQARYDGASAASLAQGTGLAVAASVVTGWLTTKHASLSLAMEVEMGLTCAAATLFALRCLQTRRWLVLPATAWAAAGFALVFFCMAAFPKQVSLDARGHLVRTARDEVARWEVRSREVDEWHAGRTPVHVGLLSWRPKGVWYVVGVPFGIPMTTAPQIDAQRFSRVLSDADRNWAQYGAAWAQRVKEGKQNAEARLEAAKQGLTDVPSPAATLLMRWVACVVQVLTVLFVYNSLALLIGALGDTLGKSGRPFRGPPPPRRV